jgi:hypothetical protein
MNKYYVQFYSLLLLINKLFFSEYFVRKLPDSPDIEWDKDVLEKEILSVVYGLQPNKVKSLLISYQ